VTEEDAHLMAARKQKKEKEQGWGSNLLFKGRFLVT
jgi:hypothetical protein